MQGPAEVYLLSGVGERMEEVKNKSVGNGGVTGEDPIHDIAAATTFL